MHLPKFEGATKCLKTLLNPLDVGRVMIFDKDQKIYGLAIEAKVERGNLRKLAEIAESLDITVRFIQFFHE
ncbi:MAG: hypothetical protein QXR79_03635 [Candidatus Bathyarchaeia archaeon]